MGNSSKKDRGDSADHTGRIRNITDDVERERRLRQGRKSDTGSFHQEVRSRRTMPHPSPASQLSREFEEEDRRKAAEKRRRRKRRQRLRHLKICAALFLVLIIVICGLILMNYMQGSRYNSKGLKLYTAGEYESAREMFETALEKDEVNAEYLINYGMTCLILGDYEEALVAFEEAEVNTTQDSLLELAKRGSGIVYLSSGHYSMAVDLFTEALSYADDDYTDTEIDILYYLAEALEQNGDALTAVECYTTIIDLTDEANAYMLRGFAYQNSGDNESAEADLETALNMSKKNYKLYLALYEVLIAQDKTQEAAQILEEAVSLGGKTGEDFSNLGIVYMYQEDYEKAQEAFDTALDKGYTGAYLGLAQSLERQGDYASAALQYEAYLESESTNASAYNQYGLCLMVLERYEDALAAFETGLALNDRLVDRQLMFNEAIVYEYLNDWDTAYEKMTAFMEKYPDDTQGAHELTFLQALQS